MFMCSCNGLIYRFSAPIQQLNISSIECYKFLADFFHFAITHFSSRFLSSLHAIGNTFSRVWMGNFSALLILPWHRFHEYGRSQTHTHTNYALKNGKPLHNLLHLIMYFYMYIVTRASRRSLIIIDYFLLCIRVLTLRNGATLHWLWTQPVETVCHVFGMLQVNRVRVEASN